MSRKCISHFKMLRSVSGTYYGEVALTSPIFFVFIYIYSIIYTVDFLFCCFFINIYFFITQFFVWFWSHYFWFSNLCHHQDPILPIGILKPMMLLLWTVHHLKDPHYSNVDCTLGDTLKMLYAYFRQFVRTPYLILGGSLDSVALVLHIPPLHARIPHEFLWCNSH